MTAAGFSARQTSASVTYCKSRIMSQTLQIELELPDDLARFRLPAGVQARLEELLNRQDGGEQLSESERSEAEGLVNLAELLTLLRLRAENRAGSSG